MLGTALCRGWPSTSATEGRILTRVWQVLSGDFHQLPPVAKGAAAASRRFAFEAASWSRCVDACYQLTTVYRQVLPVYCSS